MTKIIEAQARITARDATGGVFAAIAGKLRGLEGVSKGLNSSFAGMVGSIASLAGPAAIGAVATRSVAAFADLDRKMTRIGITADTSGASVKAATKEVQDLALAVALPTDEVSGALDALVAQGKSLPEAMAYLPAVVKTAQAAGAEAKDIATTAGAIGDQMGITAGKMQGAFDILVSAGKAGKFELKDMARYLPALAPLAASVGMKGEEGLRRLAATAQVVRNQTGTAEEAAASLQNIFAKMESEETTKKFAKFGVDLRKEMEKARKEGKDLLTVFVGLAEKATKGDLSKVPQLFSDMEFARGMRALLSQKGAVDAMAASLRDVDGSTLRDLNTVLGTTKTSIDRASEAWRQFQTRLGEKLAPAAERILGALNRTLESAPDVDGLPTYKPGENATIPRDERPAPTSAANAYARYRRDLADANAMGLTPGGLATAARAHRNEAPDEGWGALSVARQRELALRAGRMTPGMMIEREEQLAEWLRSRPTPETLGERLPIGRRQEAFDVWNAQGRAAAREIMELERARAGGAAPTAESVESRYREIQGKPGEIEIKGDVQTQVDVKVTADEGLIATIVRKVTEAVGVRAVNSNGPGSTGRSMPEAAAPSTGGGSDRR